ncbi:DUF2975 domain-containing protein [Paenibacillus sp. IB182496]|uniref:DUF2975 domain-containing protein n=1 Tax=Paenibacillus sabuli TaxID=2772509 RepID=A0A927BUX4_9BACL|nr:DUF2975 domain-containing protein [Paenibacillus sabuli]MBD2846351.1 DUF2975 domain-containing protein [Paenibacillus sabuli]
MNATQRSTLFLKIALLAMGLAGLALCLLWLPGVAADTAETNPQTAYLRVPFLICAYVAAIPYFLALVQAYRLLTYIDGDQAFSTLSVRALLAIKRCAVTVSVLLAAGTLFAVLVESGATGVVRLGCIVVLASSVIATFAAVLQRLLQEAVAIKSEHDLTV